MKMQKHWYLGLLGLIGLFDLPQVIGVFQSDGSWWDLTGILWFLWFLYLIPESKDDAKANPPSSPPS